MSYNKYRGRKRGGYGNYQSGSSNNSRTSHSSSTQFHTPIGKYIASLHGKPYGSLKGLQGRKWDLEGGSLSFIKIQADPYAPPSIASYSISCAYANFPKELISDGNKKTAVEDFLLRRIYKQLIGKADLRTLNPSQSILLRSDMKITNDGLEYRFQIQLPQERARKVDGYTSAINIENHAANALAYLPYSSFSEKDKLDLENHINCHLDQLELREIMKQHNIISFVRNGAILPRESGVKDTPLSKDKATPFKSPPSLEREFKLSNCTVTGMAIPKGIFLICGGGFHGKSTLMNAIARGIYNHIPNDGREFVLTDQSAIEIQAEDGRNIESVDISNFISNLPGSINTSCFTTNFASGSTSQATNIIESIEMGSKVLLIDEDKTATNFMCRDRFMSKLITSDKEPITPFISKARALFNTKDVSSILVIGGLGEYFAIADTVIAMDNYLCKDVTEIAKQIMTEDNGPVLEQSNIFKDISERIISSETWNSYIDHKLKMIESTGIKFGKDKTLDLTAIHFEEEAQLKMIIEILHHLKKHWNSNKSFNDLYQIINQIQTSRSLDINFASYQCSEIRTLELACVINRYRSLKIQK